ncbi:uncharacterized protein ISCGN_027837 [Ixodes scapularis]
MRTAIRARTRPKSSSSSSCSAPLQNPQRHLGSYPEVVSLNSATAGHVIQVLKSIFARHGIPSTLRSDNGPPFQSHEFARFMASYGIVHQTSGPNFPQSNGEAERMVRTVKNLLRKAHDPCLALLNYRDTPGPSGFSPAQLLMGRRLRTRLPKEGRLLVPSSKPLEEVATKAAKLKRRQVTDFDRRHRARSLSPLEDGTRVWVRPERVKATVLSPAQRPRSYVVEKDEGEIWQRNRRNLVPSRTGSEDPTAREEAQGLAPSQEQAAPAAQERASPRQPPVPASQGLALPQGPVPPQELVAPAAQGSAQPQQPPSPTSHNLRRNEPDLDTSPVQRTRCGRRVVRPRKLDL